MSEIVEKKNEVAMPTGSWGAADNLNVDEITLGRIWLMQALSGFVTDERAKQGEYRDSVSGDLLGDSKNPLEIMILGRYLTWMIMDGQEYKETLPVTDKNRGWSYHAEGGVTRSKTL